MVSTYVLYIILVIQKGKKSKQEIEDWLKNFQENVNEILHGLIFTCCLWDKKFPG